MKKTEAQSAALKREFKDHLIKRIPLPTRLLEAAKRFPCEWSEACDEFERWGHEPYSN